MDFSLLLTRYNRLRKRSPVRNWAKKGIVVVWCILLTGCAIPFLNTKGTSDTKKNTSTRDQLVKPRIAKENKIGPSVKVTPEPIKDRDEKTESNDSSSMRKANESQSEREENRENRDSRKKGSDASEASTRNETKEIDGPFKKHDHSKYTKRIRNAAIDTLNKHRSATYAALCRNSTTDLWTLTIYFKTARMFEFTSFFWDEIDGEMGRSV